MSRVAVISQPMFLPWIGLFEQVRLADVFVHYDDVQLPQGRSFVTRVQIKTANGIHWLTAPIDRGKSGRLINEVVFFDGEDWRQRHLTTLRHAYAGAPHFKLMFEIAGRVLCRAADHLAEFNVAAIEEIAGWLGLAPRFLRSSELGVTGASTERLIDLCRCVECDTYVTGHGALNYLDHEAFEARGIAVRYIDYRKVPYPQPGTFTPYVSILDAIAHCGEATRELLCSEVVDWRTFKTRQASGASTSSPGSVDIRQ